MRTTFKLIGIWPFESLSKTELSPLLYLCEMLGVVKESAQTLKWIYYGISSYTCRAEKSLAKSKAGKAGIFFKPKGTQASAGLTHVGKLWEECEKPVLSWEPECRLGSLYRAEDVHSNGPIQLVSNRALSEKSCFRRGWCCGGDMALESDFECDLAVVDLDAE
jgi:hypothetical protein